MTLKHTPATPLPWAPVSERANEGMGAPIETELRGANRQVAVRLGRLYNDSQKQDAAYIAHAANSYPKLIAALRCMNHMGGDERGGYCICPRNDGSAPDSKHATICADVRILLRELGEAA